LYLFTLFNNERAKCMSIAYMTCIQNPQQTTHQTDTRRGYAPTEFPPFHWIISNHILNTIIESLNTITP
jgi:hypothetical protein